MHSIDESIEYTASAYLDVASIYLQGHQKSPLEQIDTVPWQIYFELLFFNRPGLLKDRDDQIHV
jgi:hypothetical protein